MTKLLLKTAFALLVFMLLPLSGIARTYKGTITIEVGEDYSVDVGFAYSTVSGYWSKSNSTFGFSSQGSKSCTIYGINVGTGTLTWKGVVNADDFEYYWNVEVKNPDVLIAEINATNFPDEKFRAYLSSKSFGWDGKIMKSEIEGITAINVNDKGIESLKGIEYLTALKELQCVRNQLTSLDVSKNTKLTKLWCNSNNLTTLDVSTNTLLTDLSCGYNPLANLDISNNTLLQKLECGNNSKLTNLDVSNNKQLKSISCIYTNISSLDFSNNPELTDVYCNFNSKLESLNVSKNTKLESLNVGSSLTSLDIQNNTILKELFLNGKMSSLDLSKNKDLEVIVLYSRYLKELDISNNSKLRVLNCTQLGLTSLDISKNPLLTTLYCYNNKLASLDVSKNPALTKIDCYKNMITGSAMDRLINGLPKNETSEPYYIKIISNSTLEKNKCTKSQVARIKAKGWTPLYSTTDGDGGDLIVYEGSEDEVPTLKGDVNGDGEVNGTDLVTLTNMILGKGEKKAAADVNGDGEVNGTDYVTLVNIVLGKK